MKKMLSIVLSVAVAAVMLLITMIVVPSATITEEAEESYDIAAFGE